MKLNWILVVCALVGCATEAELVDDGRPPKIEIYNDAAGECRWKVISSNGKIIAESSEGYRSKESCERSLEIAKRAAEADVVDSR